MTGRMTGLRDWLRPPRNLLLFFLLIFCLPAAALVALGVRLLEQDRALARQREIEDLERAADQAVRFLIQDFTYRRKLFESGDCPRNLEADTACLIFTDNGIAPFPPGRIFYYPGGRKLTEVPTAPFVELESFEVRPPTNLDKALEISRTLANSPEAGVRAGALLRQGRILRKLARTNEALDAFDQLSRATNLSLHGEPVDLVARRMRCAMFEELSRRADLTREAQSIVTDLHSGKWQLDRETFEYVDGKVHEWLGESPQAHSDTGAYEVAVGRLYEKWMAKPSRGVEVIQMPEPMVLIWSFPAGAGSAGGVGFVARSKFIESNWIAAVQRTVEPARLSLVGIGEPAPEDLTQVQRPASESGLPWAIIVSNPNGSREPQAFADRRRNLMFGLAVLIVLMAAGSYFIWRAVHRELAVARLQSDFVSTVSHEFRTPLTALRQFNELLGEEDGPSPEQRRKFYQAQTRATERLHRLVESVLDFQRMEARRHPFNFMPIDAAALAQNVAEEFQHEVNPLGFEVKCNVSGDAHRISADVESMYRALWNLLDNAVKYSGDSRRVELHVSRMNGTVSMSVRDFGIGIPPAEQKAIFQKFVRGSASTSAGIRGTGLGLAMVRNIVEAHGGDVNVESALGKGSTFTISLTAAKPEGDGA